MSYGFVVSAVNAGAALAAHAAFRQEHDHSAYKLNFPLEFAEKLSKEINHLTSPFPFTDGLGLSGAIGAGQLTTEVGAATLAGALQRSSAATAR